MLAVHIAAGHVEPHEWIEEGKPYREFLVPTDVINTHGRVQPVDYDEEPGR